MRSVRRRLRRQDGVVAVEFALILPLLLVLVIGAIEFGKVYSQYQVFQGAAREGARCAAVQAGEAAFNLPVCNIQNRIDDASGSYTPAADATVTVNGVAWTPPGPPYACSNNSGENVTVSWEQPLEIDIPFWPGSGTVNATIEGVFRCE